MNEIFIHKVSFSFNFYPFNARLVSELANSANV